MEDTLLFNVVLAGPICVEGLTEDGVRELANALKVKIPEDVLSGVVTAPKAMNVKVVGDSTGNFGGITAVVNGTVITLVGGVGSKQLGIFEGPINVSNPGPGWEVDVEGSKLFNVSDDQSTWEYFLARRVNVLNTITS